MIQVSIEAQRLTLSRGEEVVFEAPVSTATKGVGFAEGSYQTPTGRFMIREKIGEGAPLCTSFKGRLPQGIWKGEEESDAILTRILWLDGLDVDNSNTYGRYIYFHGTNQEDFIGTPVSHGCIRLRNEDMVRLFDLVKIGCPVEIS